MKRTFTACGAVAVILASLALWDQAQPGSEAKENQKLNVLFIAVDDLRPELGCYGNSIIKTPNIDRLASAGTRFDLAYCQYPLCNPSRTSLFTGRHPTSTGVLDNRTWFRAEHADWVTMPQHFKANGYVSLRTGKQFHGGIDDTDAWTEGGEARNFTGASNTAAPGQNPANSDRIIKLEGDGESHGDYKSATRAIAYLEKYKDQPFFLALGFAKPHSPPTAPQKMFDLYDVNKMALPVDFAARPKAPEGFPAISIPQRNADLFIGRDASEAEAREVIRAYYASISFVDDNVGRVMAALDRLKLRDKTIVVFWGDHGYHLGEKGKWSKANSLYEVGTRVPLIIVPPNGSPNGPPKGKAQTTRATVQLLDMYPTLVEMCGLPQPSGLQGHSLTPLLKNPKAKWTHPAYTVTYFQNKLGKDARNERWRYAEWEDGKSGAMLFDHSKDPHELKNLANDPAHAKVVSEMKTLLERMPK